MQTDFDGVDTLTPLPNPELVFGLISPAGVNLEPVISLLKRELTALGYKPNLVKQHSRTQRQSQRPGEHIGEITRIYANFTDGEARSFTVDGKDKDKEREAIKSEIKALEGEIVDLLKEWHERNRNL